MITRTTGSSAGSHATHDRFLIAARAAGDLAGRDLEQADAILSACEPCQDLLAELRSIATATRHLPPPVRLTDLDFRVTHDRAAALARDGAWLRLLRPFGDAGSGVIRPLAATLTTLGLAGLLFAAALPMLPLAGGGVFMASTGAAPETREAVIASGEPGTMLPGAMPPGDTSGGGASEGGASGCNDAEPQPNPEAKSPRGLAGPVDRAGGAENSRPDGRDDGRLAREPGPPGESTPLVPLSIGSLGAGIVLLLLRRAALRLC